MAHDEKKESKKTVFYNTCFMLRQVARHAPGLLLCDALSAAAEGLLDAAPILFTKLLFDLLGGGGTFGAVLWLIAGLAIFRSVLVLLQRLYSYGWLRRWRAQLRLRMQEELFEKARSIDLACYDAPDFYNDFRWSVTYSDSTARNILENTMNILQRIVNSAATLAVLFTIDLSLAAVVAVTVLLRLGLLLWRQLLDYKRDKESNEPWRRMWAMGKAFRVADYAKELRMTQVSENLLCAHEDASRQVLKTDLLYDRQYMLPGLLEALVGGIGNLLTLGLVLYRMMVTGSVELGGFAASVTALWSLSGAMMGIMQALSEFKYYSLRTSSLRKFLEQQPTILPGALLPEPLQTLSLEHVSFAYGSGEPVLRDVSLSIRRGEKIAIVGYNGAGKTTLIKLLMRLYDVTDGSVRYNGHDIREYDTEPYRQRIGAVFQDYRIFALSLAENVMGDLFRPEDEATVREALHRSTFDSCLEKLPHGILTEMTREFDPEGTSLSGGESQKVAIARTFARPYDLMIMDEPSSALDPLAEYELNRSIAEFAEDKTVIFISHRLSTTRHADRIYMFDGGTLAEVGSHEELMAQGGKYAAMFRLQADKYKGDGENG